MATTDAPTVDQGDRSVRADVKLVNGVTVLGNLAIDVINGAPKSPGGCASFAGVALRSRGRTRSHRGDGAPNEDHALFDPLLERFGVTGPDPALRSDQRVPAGLRRRRSPPDVGRRDRAGVGCARDRGRRSRHDVGAPRAAAAHGLPRRARWRCSPQRGHRVAYDGQGLVRADRLGPLVVDRHFPPDLLTPHQRPQARRGRGGHRRRRRRSTRRRPSDWACPRSW